MAYVNWNTDGCELINNYFDLDFKQLESNEQRDIKIAYNLVNKKWFDKMNEEHWEKLMHTLSVKPIMFYGMKWDKGERNLYVRKLQNYGKAKGWK